MAWILATGSWNDVGTWSDSELWVDLMAGPTPVASVNTNATLVVGTIYLLRVRIENTGATGPQGFRWSYNHAGAGFVPLTTTSPDIKAVAAASFINDDDVPEVLGGAGIYIANNDAATEDGTSTIPITAGGAVEAVVAFRAGHTEVFDGETTVIRLELADGSPLQAYTNSPTITWQEAPRLTIGEVTGAGNVFKDDAVDAPYKIADLVALHCGMARISASPSNQYYQGETPTPANFDAIVVALLNAGIQPYFSFVFTDAMDPSQTGIPAKTYAAWQAIGAAFATRFRAGSAFLVGQGITGLGAYGYAAINEPDHLSGQTTITYTEYHDILEGLADGVHSVESDGKVFPAGYLSGNRDQQFTGHGYCAAVADLINDGTLAGFDLHTYHSRTGARIHDTWGRSHQHDADEFLAACGITRQDAEIICTETNIRGDPDATTQDYAALYPGLTNEQIARNWFLTSMLEVWGTLRADRAVAQGPRFPWQLWTQGNPVFHMASQLDPRVELWCGHTFKMLMDLLWDMRIVHSRPRASDAPAWSDGTNWSDGVAWTDFGSGLLKLEGVGKTAWAFQDIHATWSTAFGGTFTIGDIPAGATQVQVYDGNGLIQTISTPTLQIPRHTFTTPFGKSYLFVANSSEEGAQSADLAVGISLDTTFDAAVETTPSLDLSMGGGAWMNSGWMDIAWMGGAEFGALEFSEFVDFGLALADTQSATAARTGVVTNAAAFQATNVASRGLRDTTTAAASLGATFAAKVNAAAATTQAAAFAAVQTGLAVVPQNLTATTSFAAAQTASAAVRGTVPAPTSFAAAQTARAAVQGTVFAPTSFAAAQTARAETIGAFSVPASFVTSQLASLDFFGTVSVGVSFDDTQAPMMEASGTVPISAILTLSQASAVAFVGAVTEIGVTSAEITAFSETPTEHVVFTTFELSLATTQIAKTDLDAAASYGSSLASTKTAQAAIDAAAAYAATLAATQVERADLDAVAIHPATFASAQTGGSGADADLVVSTIVDDTQTAKTDLDGVMSAPLIAGAAQAAIAAPTGVVAAGLIAGAEQATIVAPTGVVAAGLIAAETLVVTASLNENVQAAVNLDDAEALAATAAGIVAAHIELSVDQVPVVAAFGLVDFAASAGDELGAVSSSDSTIVVTAQFGDQRIAVIHALDEIPAGDVAMTVVVEGGAGWLGTRLGAKWPNIGVAA